MTLLNRKNVVCDVLRKESRQDLSGKKADRLKMCRGGGLRVSEKGSASSSKGEVFL